MDFITRHFPVYTQLLRRLDASAKATLAVPLNCLLLLYVLPMGVSAEPLQHQLSITLQPDTSRIEVEDTIHLPPKFVGQSRIHFLLHDGLAVSAEDNSASVSLEKDETVSEPLRELSRQMSVPVRQYTLRLAQDTDSIRLHYQGVINHPLADTALGPGQTPGLISKDGVFLAQSTLWYPIFAQHQSADAASASNDLVTFTATVTLPAGWQVVSQGKRTMLQQHDKQTITRWEEHKPQDDIYLVAGRYQPYLQAAGNVQAMVFLREPDAPLAQRYLDVTGQYIDMYSRLLGPYPYAKFALVENFWNTGYGMPSFTLLGPQVIRFPFILHSSYPHEILHNWWGNSVYVDYDHGNWCEGLTAYLADHLIKQQHGQGVQYRRSVLQKYTDYVSKGRDFPLSEFRSRHSSATEAVGYGKALMLFHMLRQHYGDATFVAALRQLYRQYQFKLAGFNDVQQVFSHAVGEDLQALFAQWVQRSGAPDLRIDNVAVKPQGEAFAVRFTLQQRQAEPAYQLTIPLAIQLARQDMAYQTRVSMNAKSQRFSITVPARPLRLAVDPEFDVFRRLDSREIPAAMSQGFGAEQVLLLLPAAAPPELQAAYRTLAETWQQNQSGEFEIKLDKELDALPSDRAVWLLGWNNRFVTQMQQALKQNPATLQARQVSIKGERYNKDRHALVMAARNPANTQQTLVWLATTNARALPGLARKLPHYRKYSYLVFQGDAPHNVAKGQWDVAASPMSVMLDAGQTVQGVIPPLKLKPRHALAQLPLVNSPSRLQPQPPVVKAGTAPRE